MDIESIKKDIEYLRECTSTPGEGVTRLSLSEQDRKAREYLIDQMEQIGLDIKIETPGNIRARLLGKEPSKPIIMVGSHIDSVLNGGAFDGVAGVIASLEALRVIEKNNIKTRHSIELVIFMEEEGTRFGKSLLGSNYLVGKIGQSDLDKFIDSNGVTLKEASVAFGMDVDKPINQIQPKEIKAMLELHIEQSVILDVKKIPIGIVEGIAGIRWLEVKLRGLANHAGATPMAYRQDALVGAVTVISKIPEIVSLCGTPQTVGTVGKLICSPNATNVIPEYVEFTIDIRDMNKDAIDKVTQKLEKVIKEVAKKHNLSYEIDIRVDNPPVYLSQEIVNLVEKEAQIGNIPYTRIISGAAHDAMVLSEFTDVGMIFVPSINGRSHCPEEKTAYKDLKMGTELLLSSLLNLAERME